jgi:hypothetical protein
VLGDLFSYVFLDLDPAESFNNRIVAVAETTRLGEKMQTKVKGIQDQHFPSIRNALGLGRNDALLGSYGSELVRRLLRAGKGVDEAVWTIIPTAAAACATQAQGVSMSPAVLYSWKSLTVLFCVVGSDD